MDVESATKASEALEENHKQIENHSDVAYVNGSYGTTDHQNVLQNVKDVNAIEIQLIKMGTCVNDHCEKTKDGSKNPCFHGYDNYMANYYYMLYVANKFKEKKTSLDGIAYPSTATVFKDYKTDPFKGKKKSSNIEAELKGVASTVFKGVEKGKYVYNAFGIKQNTEELNFKGEDENLIKKYLKKKKLTGYGKACVVLGMALHSASDAFAHRASRLVETRNSYDARKNAGANSAGIVPISKIEYEWMPLAHCKATEESIQNKKEDKKHISYEWCIAKYSSDKNYASKYKYDVLYSGLAGADDIDFIHERYDAAQYIGQISVAYMKHKPDSKNASGAFRDAIMKATKKSGVTFKMDRLVAYYKEIVGTKKEIPKIFSEANMLGMEKVKDIDLSMNKGVLKITCTVDKNGQYVRLYTGTTESSCDLLISPTKAKIDLGQENVIDDKSKMSFAFTTDQILANKKKNKYIMIKCYRGGEVLKAKKRIKIEKKIKYCIPSKNKTIKGKERKQIIKFPSTGKIKENWFKCKGKKFSHWKTKKKKYTPGTKIVIENEKTLTLYPVFVKKEKKKAKKKSSKKKK